MRLIRVLITILLLVLTFLSFSYPDDYTRWELPEGAKLRLGKGNIPTNMLNQFPPYIFSPDSTKLVVMSLIGIWLYDVKTGKEIALYPMELDRVRWRLNFKPNSNILVCGDRNGIVHFWDIIANKPIKKYTSHTNSITCTSFNSDGSMLATGSGDETIRLWDTKAGNYQTINVGDRPDTLLFNPNGETLASCGRKGIMLWNSNTGQLKHILENTGNSFRIAFSPDGQTLASSKGKDTLFWNTETGKISRQFKDTRERTFFAFSPDGKWFATVGKDYDTVHLWDVHTGELKIIFRGTPVYEDVVVINEDGSREKVKESSNLVNSFTFSPDGNTLAVSYLNEEIVLWDIFTGKRQTTLEGQRNVYLLMFSPDGHTLVSLNGYGIYLSDINTEDIKKSKLRHTITEHHSAVNSIAFSPNGQTLASAHKRSLQLWNIANGQQKKYNSETIYKSEIQSLDYSPDGKILAGYYPFGLLNIVLWDTSIAEQIASFNGRDKNDRNGNTVYHTGQIVFSPDSKKLASVGIDNTVRLWDVTTKTDKSLIGRFRRNVFGNQMDEFKGHTDKIKVVAYSPNGQMLASGSDDKSIRLWDVHTRKPKAILNYKDDIGSSAKLNSLVFSPDSKILASGIWDGAIDLWDAVTMEHIDTLIIKNPRGNTFLAFSPDSTTLASGVAKSIILWDMQTQKPKTTFKFKDAQGFVESIQFSPDGRSLASGSSDGTVLIWKIE